MKKILVIRFSSIGDIVLTTPVVRCLREQTGAEIHYLTKAAYFPLLGANPYLSKIFTIKKKVAEVLPQLRREGYDCIVDLHKNLRSTQVKLGLRKQALSFDKLNWEKWLLVNFKIDRMPKVHIVDRYLNAVKPLGVQNDGMGLDYFFPKDFQSESVLQITSHQSPIIAFAIGAAHPTKRLPMEKIVEICQKAERAVVLLGGPSEFAEGEKIAAQSGPHVMNAAGKLSLHESAAVIRNAERVLTHDTGMMHIAAALGKEVISIWGNTVPALGMTPYFGKNSGSGERFEVAGLSCRPCSKIGFAKCPKGHFRCMMEQDVDAIAKRLNITPPPVKT